MTPTHWMILAAVVIALIYWHPWKREGYDAIPDDVGKYVPENPGVEYQYGAVREPKEYLAESDLAQQDISAKITNELVDVQD